jgi:alanine racemase
LANSNSQTSTLDGQFFLRPTQAVIDLGAIARNYRLLRERVGERVSVIPVVKADAYGHGAVAVARRLEGEGAGRLAVAVVEEGIALRRAGVGGQVLLLNFSDPADVPLHRGYDLIPTLYDLEQAAAFARAAETLTAALPVHVKLDTGMGRVGIRPEDVGSLVEILRRAPRLRLRGVFAQLSSAEDPQSPATAAQIRGLRDAVASLRSAGLDPGLVHLANSAGVFAHPDSYFDAVRPGIALYGVLPSEALGEQGLEPAMTLVTRVMSVKRAVAGTPLGYGGAFVTKRASTIAVLPIGYHDGLRRSFSGRVSVLLRGREAPIVGAVSMDLTLVDATGCGASPGDRVVCLGADAGRRVTAWDLARAAGTIPYEVLCGIGPRVPRVFV